MSSNAVAVTVFIALALAGAILFLAEPGAGGLVVLSAVVGGLVRIFLVDWRTGSSRTHRLPDANDPRWLPPDGRPQIVGRDCAACGRKITVSLEGATCETCSVACHAKCVDEHRRHEHRPRSDVPYR